MNTPALPKTLKSFVWFLLKSHQWSLLVFAFVSIVWASEISLSPYLLKLIIDGVVGTANDSRNLLQIIWIPTLLYASMSMLINLTFRLYDYTILIVIPKIKADI